MKNMFGVRYMAPEMIAMLSTDMPGANVKGYTMAVDYWSLGVCMFRLLTGRMPFHASHFTSFVNYIACIQKNDEAVSIKYKDDYKYFLKGILENNKISPECSVLLNGFLELDDEKRLGYGSNGINQIKAHPYFANVDWHGLGLMRELPAYCIPSKEYISMFKLKQNHTPCTFKEMFVSSNRKNWLGKCPTVSQQSYFSKWYYL